MDQYVTGAAIRALRERCGLTQAELAEKLCVSDKTISKWETGKGLPDISLLQPLAAAFRVSVAELLAGSPVQNTNVSANMMRTVFHVCPVCGNVLLAAGEASVSCHGIALPALAAEEPDAHHAAMAEKIEDEIFVSVDHEMTKSHYISFMAAVSGDRVQLVKLYPEGPAEARFRRSGIRRVYYYCNQDGLFCIRV